VPVPYVYKHLSFDILRDLAPVATVGILDGFLMLVNPATPVRTVPEFIDYAKNNRVLYGTPGVGNILHLVTELFRIRAGIEMDHIPFKGASEVQTALLGGNITMMFVTPPSVIGVVKEGQLRALAYTGAEPFPEFADVPLMKTYYPDFKVSGSWGMFYAPAKTPRGIVDRLNAAINKAIASQTFKDRFAMIGDEPAGGSPEEFAEVIRKDSAKWADVVARSGAKLD
jgi:tripartite-type tricarboxylate transporter receptor subunit TctC